MKDMRQIRLDILELCDECEAACRRNDIAACKEIADTLQTLVKQAAVLEPYGNWHRHFEIGANLCRKVDNTLMLTISSSANVIPFPRKHATKTPPA